MATIYKIIGGDECYIGSTTCTAQSRYISHKYRYTKGYKECSSFLLFERYDTTLEILETDVPVEERFKRERYWIDSTIGTVNVTRPFVTQAERKQVLKAKYERLKGKYLKLHECECGKSYSLTHKARHLKTHKA